MRGENKRRSWSAIETRAHFLATGCRTSKKRGSHRGKISKQWLGHSSSTTVDWLGVFVAPIREDDSRGARRWDMARGPFADSQAVQSLKQQWVGHRRCPSGRDLGPLGCTDQFGCARYRDPAQRYQSQARCLFQIHAAERRWRERPATDQRVVFGGQPRSRGLVGQHHGAFTSKS